jgi:hypothetical protein
LKLLDSLKETSGRANVTSIPLLVVMTTLVSVAGVVGVVIKRRSEFANVLITKLVIVS